MPATIANLASIVEISDLTERISALKEALESGGSDAIAPMLRARLARELAQNDDVAGALRELNLLLQKEPETAPLLLKAAYLLRETPEDEEEDLGRGDLLQSPKLLKRMFAPLPNEDAGASVGDFFCMLRPTARAIRRAGRIDEEQNGLETAWALLLTQFCQLTDDQRPTDGPRLLIQMAAEAGRADRDDVAAELAAFGARQIPASGPLKAAAIRHAAAVGRWGDCRKTAEALIKADPSNLVAWSYRALAGLMNPPKGEAPEKTIGKAKEIFDKYTHSHDPDYLALLSLAFNQYDPLWAKDSVKDRERLAEEGDEALPKLKFPEKPGRLCAGAEKLLMAERYAEGLKLLDSGEGMKPASERLKDGKVSVEQTEYLLLRGYALFKLKRPLESYTCLSLAIEAAPMEQQMLSFLGQAAYYVGRHTEAISYLLEIQPVGPDDFSAYFYLGLCYDALGDRPQARRVLAQAFSEFFFDNLEEINLRPMIKRVYKAHKL